MGTMSLRSMIAIDSSLVSVAFRAAISGTFRCCAGTLGTAMRTIPAASAIHAPAGVEDFHFGFMAFVDCTSNCAVEAESSFSLHGARVVYPGIPKIQTQDMGGILTKIFSGNRAVCAWVWSAMVLVVSAGGVFAAAPSRLYVRGYTIIPEPQKVE